MSEGAEMAAQIRAHTETQKTKFQKVRRHDFFFSIFLIWREVFQRVKNSFCVLKVFNYDTINSPACVKRCFFASKVSKNQGYLKMFRDIFVSKVLTYVGNAQVQY